MGTNPAGVDQPVAVVNEIEGIALDIAFSAARAYIAVQFPWTTIPIVQYLIGLIFGAYETKLAERLRPQIDAIVISHQVDTEKGDYAAALKAYSQAKGTGDPVLIAKARADLNAAIDRLAHSDGS